MAKNQTMKGVLSKSFVDNHDSVNEDVASDLIVKAEQKIREIKEERAADERLAQAKQIVKDLNTAYSSTIKYEQAKIEFLLEKIAEIQVGSTDTATN